MRLWKLAAGISFQHKPTLSNAERRAYISEAQGLRVVQTSDDVHPYLSGTCVDSERDAALLRAIAERHETKPGVISS